MVIDLEAVVASLLIASVVFCLVLWMHRKPTRKESRCGPTIGEIQVDPASLVTAID